MLVSIYEYIFLNAYFTLFDVFLIVLSFKILEIIIHRLLLKNKSKNKLIQVDMEKNLLSKILNYEIYNDKYIFYSDLNDHIVRHNVYINTVFIKKSEISAPIYKKLLHFESNKLLDENSNFLFIKNNEGKKMIDFNNKVYDKTNITNNYFDNGRFKKFYKIESLINEGGFAKVYKVNFNLENKIYAIKTINISTNNNFNYEFQNEIIAMSRLSHNNIAKYFTSWLENIKSNKIKLYIQMKFYKRTLHDLLYVEKQKITKKEALSIFINIVNGIRYLHSKGVIHRDLKPSNIFINNKLIPKIGDFGLVTTYLNANNIQDLNNIIGTPLYMPPEMFNDGIMSKKCDSYALGIIYFELLNQFTTNHQKFREIKNFLDKNIISDKMLELELETNIINELTNRNYKERIDVNEIFKSKNFYLLIMKYKMIGLKLT